VAVLPRTPRALLARQFSALAIFNYRVYFFGQVISLAGTWMQSTAQAWLVLRLTGSPLALSTVTTLQFLPITLLSLFGGVLADRVPRRTLLITTQTLALVQALVLGTLVALDAVQLWHVYVLAFALGTLNALDNPARQSFVYELVGRDDLFNAIALNSTMFNIARACGPALAGLTIGAVGIAAAFYLNAISFVAVLIGYAVMRPASFRAPATRALDGSIAHQLAEGIGYAFRSPPVLYTFILVAFVGTFGFNFQVLIPLVAEFVLHTGPEKFGLLTSCLGAGALSSALILAGQRRPRTRLLLLASAAFAVLLVAIAFSTSYATTAALLFLLGAASLAFGNTANSSLQLAVPDHLRGRVMSIYFLLFAGSTPAGGYLLGFCSERYGTRVGVVLLGALTAAGVLVAMAYRRMHAGEMTIVTMPAAAPAAASPQP